MGIATVTGAGSSWSSGVNFLVGINGTGTLTISDGGVVSSTNSSYLGAYPTGLGTATITGAGSSWSSSNEFYVGLHGTGSLTISDEGTVTSTSSSYIGASSISTGTAAVTGTGSSWSSGADFFIGYDGSGTLTISDGGTVTNTNTSNIGISSTGIGIATVTGAGSSWSSGDQFIIGDAGTGSLTISDSATVAATSMTIASQAGSVGTLNIGSASGDKAVATGILDTSTVTFGDGIGSLVFNHTEGCGDGTACAGVTGSSTSYDFTADVSGSGSILAKSGFTVMSGDLSAFTGTTTISSAASLIFSSAYGGNIIAEDDSTVSVIAPVSGSVVIGTGSTLAANSTISGTVIVNSGGTLKGSGTIGTTTITSGGIVAAGNSIGTINISGDVSFASGSYLDVEVDADGNSDLTHATGTATISGGTVRLSPELSTDTYALDTAYTILTADTAVTGTFDAITFLSGSSLFLTPTLSYDTTNVYATVSRNGTSFSSVAYTPNQEEIARALNTASTGAALWVVGNQTTAAETREAMNNLNGELHANVKGELLEQSEAFAHVINAQQNDGYWAVFYGSWKKTSHASYHGFEAEKTALP